MLPRYLLILLVFTGIVPAWAQKKRPPVLSGQWTLRYLEVNQEPVWNRSDSMALFRFAKHQIGKEDLASDDSLVIIEKIRGLDPNFRKMSISFSAEGCYEFVQVNSEDLFTAPVTEKGTYREFDKQQAVQLTDEQGNLQTLQYTINGNELKLFGIQESDGYWLFIKKPESAPIKKKARS